MQGHQACPKTTIASLPSRVVDVGTQDDSEEPRVYISKGQKSSYAALSYYWGGPQSMVLTMSTVDSLMQGIDMSKLPQTIKDAIKSVRMLGLRYLWIDTLCIMQDSPQDMDLEIIKMDQYYENAHVTIAAGSASACTRGFLEYRPEFDLPLASIRYPCPDGASGNINIIKYDRYYPRFEPLNTRGWALQELALSSRVLTYGNWQLYWWCQNGLKCDGGSVSYFDQINIANLIPKKTVETDNKIEAPPIVESLLWKQWVNVVEEYSTRKLTLPRDKFPALSGIASRFATVSSDTYFAGLWKSRLLESLAWRVSDPSVRVEYEYCAPTWSWASSNRSVGFVGEGIIGKSSTGLFSQVIECVVELENPMVPFGKIKDASLKIRGIVKLIKWDGFFQIPMDGVDTSTLELSTRIGSPLFPDGIIAIAYPDYDEETVYVLNPSSPGTDTDMQDDQLWDEIQFYMSRDEVGLNQVTRSVTCLVLYNKHALILEKCTNGNYVRLGLMWFQSSTKLQEYFNGCEEMSLTIV